MAPTWPADFQLSNLEPRLSSLGRRGSSLGPLQVFSTCLPAWSHVFPGWCFLSHGRKSCEMKKMNYSSRETSDGKILILKRSLLTSSSFESVKDGRTPAYTCLCTLPLMDRPAQRNKKQRGLRHTACVSASLLHPPPPRSLTLGSSYLSCRYYKVLSLMTVRPSIVARLAEHNTTPQEGDCQRVQNGQSVFSSCEPLLFLFSLLTSTFFPGGMGDLHRHLHFQLLSVVFRRFGCLLLIRGADL